MRRGMSVSLCVSILRQYEKYPVIIWSAIASSIVRTTSTAVFKKAQVEPDYMGARAAWWSRHEALLSCIVSIL